MPDPHDTALSIVVLAAGEGTRMRSALPKVLHPICGRPMLGHVLAVADALRAGRTTLVLAPDTLDAVRARFGEGYSYAVQAERLGTGHAVLQARGALHDQPGEVLVLYGDTPLLRPETAQALLDLLRRTRALAGLVSFHADPPTGYGRVVRDAAGRVVALVEERDATPEQRAITEGNSGVMAFDAPWLWERVGRLARNPAKGEYYLTDLVAQAVAERGPGAVVALPAADPREAWGVNDRAQLAAAEAVMRERLLTGLMRSGVTITDPAATYVDVGVTVGQDTILLPGTLLQGATRVGERCVIGPHATLVDATVGDGARVRDSVVEGATVAAGAEIGPFAWLRREFVDGKRQMGERGPTTEDEGRT
jgi:bifunctional UDP-N-acetylglucosamine pyrophosphorylase/glucosamine-1-phosphate N-acetyltransferase